MITKGSDIIFDYNRDGKTDYKDKVIEMMIINKKKNDTKTTSTNNEHSGLGCALALFIIIILIILAIK